MGDLKLDPALTFTARDGWRLDAGAAYADELERRARAERERDKRRRPKPVAVVVIPPGSVGIWASLAPEAD